MTDERVYIGDESYFKDLYLVKRKWLDWEWPEIEFVKPLARGVNLIDGPPGGGKSTYLVFSSYKNRKYFGQGVVCDAPELFRPAFGPWQYLDWARLLANLDKMAKEKKMAKHMVISECLTELFLSVGVDLIEKTINIDEAGGKLNKRRGMADTIQIISGLGRKIRHLKSCLQISSQNALRCLDPNEILEWGTSKIICNYDEESQINYYAFQSKFLPKNPNTGGLMTYSFTIDPKNWAPIYNSFSPIQKTSVANTVKELVTTGGNNGH